MRSELVARIEDRCTSSLGRRFDGPRGGGAVAPSGAGAVPAGGSETVATADDGLDVAAPVESVVDLAAQLHDVDAHGVGEGVGLAVPHVVEQFLLRHDLLAVAHEVFE